MEFVKFLTQKTKLNISKKVQSAKDYNYFVNSHTSQNKLSEVRKKVNQLKKLRMANTELDELILVFTEF